MGTEAPLATILKEKAIIMKIKGDAAMKKIITLILGVAVFFSCQQVDIDSNTEITGKPLKVTAYIDGNIETRMSYDTTYNSILPHWEDGDEVFGFDNAGGTFTFTVTRSDNDEAELSVPDAYQEIYQSNGATTLYAIFAPSYDENDIDLTNNQLVIHLDDQSGVLNASTPALMCATGTIENGEVELHFTNQTAIIGVKKFQLNGTSSATTVTGLTLNGVITDGIIAVDPATDKLKLTPGSTISSITASGSWGTDASGVCTTAVYFAAMPTDNADLTLSATTGASSFDNLSSIKQNDIEAGKYYYMSKKLGTPVAAIGRERYETLDAAWAAAKTSATPCTVTLLSNITHNSQLDFSNDNNNAITLDLNGKILSTSTAQFLTSSEPGASLMIVDNGIPKGKITSSAANILYLVKANITVDLDGCIIESSMANSSNNIDAAVYVNPDYTPRPQITLSNGTKLYTINEVTTIYNKYGDFILSECDVTSGINGNGRYCFFATTGAHIAVNENASLYSTGSSTIHCGSSNAETSININGGYLYGTPTLTAGSNGSYSSRITINGGYFNNDVTTISGSTAATINGSIIPCTNVYHTPQPTGVQLEYSHKFTSSVAEVNGIGYSTLAAAITAANAYDGNDATVTLTLLKDVQSNKTILLTNSSNKPIVLDLKYHTLTNSSNSNYLIRTNNGYTLTIKDGNIISNDTRAIYAYQGAIYLDNCNISGACEGLVYNYQGTLHIQNGTKIKGALNLFTDENIYDTGIVWNQYGTMSITDSFIEATGAVTALLNNGGAMTVYNSEVSACTNGTSTDGIAICNYANISSLNATLIINSGSFYTKSPTQTKPVIYHYGSLGTTTINSGYFYNESNGNSAICIRANIGNNFSNITVNGGLFNINLPYVYKGNTYHPTYGTNKQVIDLGSNAEDQEPHKHNTTGQTYYYRYKVAVPTTTP